MLVGVYRYSTSRLVHGPKALDASVDGVERRGLLSVAIKRYGEDDLRRVSSKLRRVIDDHCKKTNPVKSAADRAEAASRKVRRGAAIPLPDFSIHEILNPSDSLRSTENFSGRRFQ